MSQSLESKYTIGHNNGKYSAKDAVDIVSGAEMRKIGYEGVYVENARAHRFFPFNPQSGLKTDLVQETITFGTLATGSSDFDPTKPTFTFDTNKCDLSYLKTRHIPKN